MENGMFARKEVDDSISRLKKQKRITRCDAEELTAYFLDINNKDPYFYWNVERDENKRLANFFFRDYRSAIDYEYFGDMLLVDIVYQTNKYNMVCCLFEGINHHHENVNFGCAFMSDGTESTFEWLFRTFLESMCGKQPETIFTDQCETMMNANEIVFPDSHHQLCHWHINQKEHLHFGSLNADSNFKNLWDKCMNDCESEEEFEQAWKQMVDRYNIGDKIGFVSCTTCITNGLQLFVDDLVLGYMILRGPKAKMRN